MRTLMGNRLRNRRFDQRRRMLLVELQNRDEFAHPPAFWPLLLQLGQERFIDGGHCARHWCSGLAYSNAPGRCCNKGR